ncbi:MAG TPA: hypothetical protein VGF30_00245 [Bacteroidia bacterium]
MFQKKGLLFTPDTSLTWQHSHAALPTFFRVEEDLYRVYFTSRDKDNKTYVGYFDWSPEKPMEIIDRTLTPVLEPGELGCFDSFGVQATSVIRHNNDVYMYYLGWVIGQPAPLFYTAIGLAISKDNGKTFKKYSKAPIMERSAFDPWMVSGGTVLKQGNDWTMYYISGISFGFKDGQAESIYDVKLATSADGINWKRDGITPFPLGRGETNISRISFVNEQGTLKAWFPVKRNGLGYRCGYAESTNGIQFERMDEKAGITVSEDGWDNYSIDKMDVIRYKNSLYMMYNGNAFGKDGIGLAIHED